MLLSLFADCFTRGGLEMTKTELKKKLTELCAQYAMEHDIPVCNITFDMGMFPKRILADLKISTYEEQ